MDNDLYTANSDILRIMKQSRQIRWNLLKENSIQRILYLLKIMYSFVYNNENIFSYYNFIVSLYGPYSKLIKDSLIFLESDLWIIKNDNGEYTFGEQEIELPLNEEQKEEWIYTILYILGKYGIDRIFGFIINDPLYKDAVATNSQKLLDTSSAENKTIEILNKFKTAFEETLNEAHSLSKKDYLDLYFDYIFSQIIK